MKKNISVDSLIINTEEIDKIIQSKLTDLNELDQIEKEITQKYNKVIEKIDKYKKEFDENMNKERAILAEQIEKTNRKR